MLTAAGNNENCLKQAMVLIFLEPANTYLFTLKPGECTSAKH